MAHIKDTKIGTYKPIDRNTKMSERITSFFCNKVRLTKITLIYPIFVYKADTQKAKVTYHIGLDATGDTRILEVLLVTSLSCYGCGHEATYEVTTLQN